MSPQGFITIVRELFRPSRCERWPLAQSGDPRREFRPVRTPAEVGHSEVEQYSSSLLVFLDVFKYWHVPSDISADRSRKVLR